MLYFKYRNVWNKPYQYQTGEDSTYVSFKNCYTTEPYVSILQSKLKDDAIFG